MPVLSVKRHTASLDNDVPKSYFSKNHSHHETFSEKSIQEGGQRATRPVSPSLIAPEHSPAPASPTGSSMDPTAFSQALAAGPPSIWQLQITTPAVNGMTPSLVNFYHWTDMQKPGLISAWDKWAERLMHVIYADLSAIPGEKSMFEDYLIYVGVDRRIIVNTSVTPVAKI